MSNPLAGLEAVASCDGTAINTIDITNTHEHPSTGDIASLFTPIEKCLTRQRTVVDKDAIIPPVTSPFGASRRTISEEVESIIQACHGCRQTIAKECIYVGECFQALWTRGTVSAQEYHMTATGNASITVGDAVDQQNDEEPSTNTEDSLPLTQRVVRFDPVVQIIQKKVRFDPVVVCIGAHGFNEDNLNTDDIPACGSGSGIYQAKRAQLPAMKSALKVVRFHPDVQTKGAQLPTLEATLRVVRFDPDVQIIRKVVRFDPVVVSIKAREFARILEVDDTGAVSPSICVPQVEMESSPASGWARKGVRV